VDPKLYQSVKFGGSTLIISKDPKLIGKIYKKGVRLEIHENKEKNLVKLDYSFDLE